MQNPEKSLFSDREWREIVDLVQRLNISQTQWLGDYLSQLNETPANTKAAQEGRCVVAFASETGNSKAIAEALLQKAMEQGKKLELLNLAEARVRRLGTIDQLFIICSTHGDGDPPEPAEHFYNALLALDKKLDSLSYAVLALGDSTYEKFCECGKQIDQKLSQLSAVRLIDRVDCDVDFQEQADTWMAQVLSLVKASTDNVPHLRLARSDPPNTQIDRTNPCEVELLENVCLSDPDRDNAVHHLEFSLEQVGHLRLSPGDSIGVKPHNPPGLVNSVLTLMGYSGDESVSVKNTAMPLVQAIREHVDLVVVSSKFLKKWATITNSKTLRDLTQAEPQMIRDYLKRHRLSDILMTYSAEVDAQSFIDLLRPLQPRLYDVANSLRHTPGELHLTVERYRYQAGGRWQAGIASHFLADLDEGESVAIFPQSNKKFHLPTNTTVPIIMVADGTGIAPFRAFMQEIAVDERRQHPTWLIFRERCFQEDFLYQLEWQKALEAGDLTRLDSVFYADDPSRTVLDIVSDNYALFKGWLEAGAHLYLSGHRQPQEEFLTLLGSGLKTDPDIKAVWTAMPDQGRIHRNLY
ncbi:MAG: assimilatory sulfite reductase (NADPH) flavoprotein subunit [Methylophaga sp.]